jgi:hypothetical protein
MSLSNVRFREGCFRDFSIFIDDQEFHHNKTILSLRSEFIECHLRFNSEKPLKFYSKQLNIDSDLLINAFNHLYEDEIPPIRCISEINQSWRIYDFLQAIFHRDLSAKKLIKLIIDQLDRKYYEPVKEILNSEKFSEDLFKEIFKHEEIIKVLAEELNNNILNKAHLINRNKYIELIETFNLQKYLHNSVIIDLARYCTNNGIEKDWLPSWQKMVLKYTDTYQDNVNCKAIGKRNEKGETVALDKIDINYLKSYTYGIMVNIKY